MRGFRRVAPGLALTVALLGAPDAHAFGADVVWCTNCETTWQSLLQHGEDIAKFVQQIETLQQQLQQQINTLNALAHAPQDELNQVAGALSVSQFRNALPNVGELRGIVSGNNLGSMTSGAQDWIDQNRIYQPNPSDFPSAAIATNAASIGGMQATAAKLYQASQEHMKTLQGLEDTLKSAPDEKAAADLNARINLEHTYISGQQTQLASLAVMQGSQVRLTDQQREEQRRCKIDAAIAHSQDTGQCNKPGGLAVEKTSAGTTGAGLAANFDQYIGSSVGSGQCVALVQAADPNVGLTRTWVQGDAVKGNADLAAGTPIATFGPNGTYTNSTDGSSHAAIYLGQDANGIRVEDQWVGQPAHVRTIPWSGNNQANSGSAFYVIGHGASS